MAELLRTLSFCGVAGGLQSFSCQPQLRLCYIEVELWLWQKKTWPSDLFTFMMPTSNQYNLSHPPWYFLYSAPLLKNGNYCSAIWSFLMNYRSNCKVLETHFVIQPHVQKYKIKQPRAELGQAQVSSTLEGLVYNLGDSLLNWLKLLWADQIQLNKFNWTKQNLPKLIKSSRTQLSWSDKIE